MEEKYSYVSNKWLNNHKAATIVSIKCIEEVLRQFYQCLKTASINDDKAEYLVNIIKMKWIEKISSMHCLEESTWRESSLTNSRDRTESSFIWESSKPKPFMAKPMLPGINPSMKLFEYLNLRTSDSSPLLKYKKRRNVKEVDADEGDDRQDHEFDILINEINANDFTIDISVDDEANISNQKDLSVVREFPPLLSDPNWNRVDREDNTIRQIEEYHIIERAVRVRITSAEIPVDTVSRRGKLFCFHYGTYWSFLTILVHVHVDDIILLPCEDPSIELENSDLIVIGRLQRVCDVCMVIVNAILSPYTCTCRSRAKMFGLLNSETFISDTATKISYYHS